MTRQPVAGFATIAHGRCRRRRGALRCLRTQAGLEVISTMRDQALHTALRDWRSRFLRGRSIPCPSPPNFRTIERTGEGTARDAILLLLLPLSYERDISPSGGLEPPTAGRHSRDSLNRYSSAPKLGRKFGIQGVRPLCEGASLGKRSSRASSPPGFVTAALMRNRSSVYQSTFRVAARFTIASRGTERSRYDPQCGRLQRSNRLLHHLERIGRVPGAASNLKRNSVATRLRKRAPPSRPNEPALPSVVLRADSQPFPPAGPALSSRDPGLPVWRIAKPALAGRDMKNPSGAALGRGPIVGPCRLGLQGASAMSARVHARPKTAGGDAQSIGRSSAHSRSISVLAREKPRAGDAASTLINSRCQASPRAIFSSDC